MSDERAVLEAWWREFAARGTAPATLEPVQSRLIRSVHRGRLAGGEVFVKTMTFPRARDRLRYLVRPLPATHEAVALRRTRAAGLPCPDVIDVRIARRFGLPFRSWLVLRALPAAAVAEDPLARLVDEAALALCLLEHGIEHRDLHADNFVRLQGGELAVLDMHSTRLHRGPVTGRRHRLAAAARLVRDLEPMASAEEALTSSRLVRDAAELEAALADAAAQRAAYRRRRVLRCLQESTEFTRRLRWSGVEHRRRGPLPPGRWHDGGTELRRCWIGQRCLELFGSRSPVFPAFFQKWWWLGGAGALYVPRPCTQDQMESELLATSAGCALLDEHRQPKETAQDGERPT